MPRTRKEMQLDAEKESQGWHLSACSALANAYKLTSLLRLANVSLLILQKTKAFLQSLFPILHPTVTFWKTILPPPLHPCHRVTAK